jgi:threonine dehydratase
LSFARKNNILKIRRCLGKEELVLIHPFDDPRVVAGQGTIGLEIDEDAPSDLEAVLVPVGGGLLSGIALGMKYTRPQVEVIGVESYAAPTLTEALKANFFFILPRYSNDNISIVLNLGFILK